MRTLNELKRFAGEAAGLLAREKDLAAYEVYCSSGEHKDVRLNYTSDIPSRGIDEFKSLDADGFALRIVTKRDPRETGSASLAGDLSMGAVREAVTRARHALIVDRHFPGFPTMPRRLDQSASARLQHSDLLRAPDTVLAAAQELRTRADIVFVFAGGGSEQQKVREFAHRNQLENVLCLSYQPIEKLSALLSAADLHVVVMGERFGGIVHPSKIYNILAIGSPFLYIGPAESHLGEIIERPGDSNSAFHARPGEVDLVSQVIRGRVDQHPAINPLATPTSRGSVTAPLAQEFSKAVLLPRLLAQVEALCVRAPEAETEPPATKLQSAVR